MGNSTSEAAWQRSVERCEDDLLELSGVRSRVSRSFTHIKMDGKPFRVRTFVVRPGATAGIDSLSARKRERKTLVLIHGFASGSVLWYRMLAPLSRKYRIVLFDSMAHGLNSRPEECSGVASPHWSEEG